jgi:hypothetical protein
MLPKILLTLATLGYSLIPVLADFNRTHATNPLWTGHARYHVVWQVTSYVLLAALALVLIWAPGPMETGRFLVAATIAGAIYAGFFGAAATMRMYDGKLADENGVPDVAIAGARIDLNLLVFSVIVLVLIASVVGFLR